MYGPGHVGLPCGRMFTVSHDDDGDDGNVSSVFWAKRPIILMMFYSHDNFMK